MLHLQQHRNARGQPQTQFNQSGRAIHHNSADIQAGERSFHLENPRQSERDTQEQNGLSHKHLLHIEERAVHSGPQNEQQTLDQGQTHMCAASAARSQNRVSAAHNRMQSHHRVLGLLRPRRPDQLGDRYSAMSAVFRICARQSGRL